MTPRLQRNWISLFPIFLCLVRSGSGRGWSVFGPLRLLAIMKTPLIRSLILVVIGLFTIITGVLIERPIVVIMVIVDVIVVITSIRGCRSMSRGSCMRIIRGRHVARVGRLSSRG